MNTINVCNMMRECVCVYVFMRGLSERAHKKLKQNLLLAQVTRKQKSEE